MFRSLFILLVTAVASIAAPFVHPGGLHTKEDFKRMREKVAAKEHPWIDGWESLLKDPKAQADYKASPHRHMVSRQRAQDDATAAYLNALRWQVSGEKEHAECAARILNAWADGVKEVPRGNDQPGLSGIPIGSFALAAEVLRDYPGWSGGDQKKFKNLLLTYFYPVCHDFLVRHNGAGPTNYWANWDTCNMQAIMAIGVFCDDREKFDEAVEYFKNGKGMGSIKNAAPFLYPGGLAQWQESGRDQAHAMGGMGLLVQMCQMAWNQGVDLYGYDNNRLLAAAEYTAQFTLWKGVPYTFYTNEDRANQYWISENYHGRLAAAHFELVYNHYVVRKGLKAPHVKLFAELKRPEPGDVDVFGHGTLTFTLDAKASPYPAGTVPPVPQDLVAVAGMNRVDLKWSPSGAYNARGHEIFRAESAEGPFTSIYSTDNWTTPMYADLKVDAGKTYHYKVAALNQYGVGEKSVAVSAAVAAPGDLPAGWVEGRNSARSALDGTAFSLKARGGWLGGNQDECAFLHRKMEGDFVLTGRLVERTGKVGMAGLMVREEDKDDAASIAMTLGESGGRQAKVRIRTKAGEKSATMGGNDYTWLPAWFRITRDGGNFTAFQSSDGIVWFEIGKGKITTKRECFVGLVATGEDGEVRFDNVSVVEKLPESPGMPRTLVVKAEKDTALLKWENATGARIGIKVEAAEGNGEFYEIADLKAEASAFTNTGLKDPKALRYRIRAYNAGGYSEYSNVAGMK